MADGGDDFGALAIVGCGLIGGSVAAAARKAGAARRIIAVDPDPAVRETALDLELADTAFADIHAACAAEIIDLVCLAPPPAATPDAARSLIGLLDKGALVFDVASVKGQVAEAFAALPAPLNANAIPAHPIAGTERSGPAAAFASLFTDRWCILTPHDAASEEALAKVSAFWRACGARVVVMDPAAHDALLAATSHVPHLIAYALTATAMTENGDPRHDMTAYSAGGFRDFTRIAASDPTMWRDVFLLNKDAALAALDRFSAELGALRAAVAAGDGAALADRFAQTRAVRAQIVAEGQETPAPNFGRDAAGISTPAAIRPTRSPAG